MPAPVPAAVRTTVLALAADVLGALDGAAVPVPLRAVRRFAPRRRADAGAGPLWTAVEQDDAFRAKVARAWSQAHPAAAATLLAPDASDAPVAPDAPDAPDPLTLAVGAVLLRPDGWAERVAALVPATPAPDHSQAQMPSGTHPARAERGDAELRRLTARVAAETTRADAAEAELAALRKELRRLRSDADRARAEARRSAEHAADVAAAAERVHAESARVRAQADEDRRRADDLARTARADAAVLRELAEVRVRLLLDTVVEAGAALRTELALPPAGRMPADLVAPEHVPAAARPTSRGRGADDPALLDELLAMPRAHLVVDGYNVTKLAWPDQSLAEQRRRLVERLANLAGRTGAEVTCCFDGQDAPPERAPSTPRGVRVLFSSGEIADDLIRRLVRAEPTGRVVVVVTSDRALGADLEAAGARVLPSATLLARLGRV
ncbi:NYN domain-containing protein [Cellulomonas sp. NPDC058312]|uniref:NYN domain-containing protein n=1 Tax=Cellulomonas sp. NPDC058312 TaxID=3346441 RepID=UPI0036EDA924